MNPELHIRICGVILLILAASHVAFPRFFNWREELSRLSLLNRQIFLVHTLFIGLLLVLLGLLSLFGAPLLTIPSPLATVLLIGIALFWLTRLAVQLFVYSPRLWRGIPSRTAIHWVFCLIWTYLSASYGTAAFLQAMNWI